MRMPNEIRPEYKNSILNVLGYINQHLSDELPLETLAQVANYSTLHFRKIFTDVMAESPKQYTIRLRLERSAQHIRHFRDTPISEIALNSGFSSLSVFSRAFKNYFSVSPEALRGMSCDDLNTVLPQIEQRYWKNVICNATERAKQVQFEQEPFILKMESITLAYVQTTLGHTSNIGAAFETIMQWAIPRNLVVAGSRYLGIYLDIPFYTPLEKCRYLAAVEIKTKIGTSDGINLLTVPRGKYISTVVTGDFNRTLQHALAVKEKFITGSGYQLAEPICYELFDELPAGKSYAQTRRSILLPLKNN